MLQASGTIAIIISVTTDGPCISLKMPATSQPPLPPRANPHATSLRLHRRRLPPAQASTAISLPHRRMTRPVAISSRSTLQPSRLARVLTGAVMLPRPRQ
ncbi:uncharacterized protein TrAtP1_001256 [Trichoderma atroviride]|uniref:uncharacterized protein n=1 Tax=Hypocrea atroviridis TaxID=63577 RepID=UPI0033249F33|nr:hypothetical protein TrAtP1_001256 [Trichoderma atroviride]